MSATNVFAQHETAPALASPLLRHMCEHWTQLNRSAESRHTIEAWAQTDKTFDSATTPGDIVDRIHQAGPAGKDTLLRALLDLAQNGDRLAGDVLLQQMLPVLATMPKTIRTPRGEDSGYETGLQRVLVAFWEVIRKPRQLSRPGVAGRLRMDTLHEVTAHQRRNDAWDHVQYGGATDGPAVREDHSSQSDLVELLRWTRETGLFTADEARFFGEVYLVDDGDQKACAERLGISHAAIRQRVTRLRSRLCGAVVADTHKSALLAIAA